MHSLQVVDIERDINKALAGAGGELVYKTLTGLKADLTVESKPVLLCDETNDQKEEDANERKYFTIHFVVKTFLLKLWSFRKQKAVIRMMDQTATAAMTEHLASRIVRVRETNHPKVKSCARKLSKMPRPRKGKRNSKSMWRNAKKSKTRKRNEFVRFLTLFKLLFRSNRFSCLIIIYVKPFNSILCK